MVLLSLNYDWKKVAAKHLKYGTYMTAVTGVIKFGRNTYIRKDFRSIVISFNYFIYSSFLKEISRLLFFYFLIAIEMK